MRQFLNTRTGAVIDVPCRIEGPDWKEITEAKPEAAPEKAAEEEKPATRRKAKKVT